MSNLKRTGVLLAGLLVLSGLSACAIATGPLVERSLMHKVVGSVANQYDRKECQKAAQDCSKVGKQEQGNEPNGESIPAE